MRNRILIGVLFVFMAGNAAAQLSINFIPELYGRRMDGLMNASILNTGGRQNVRLSVVVTEDKAGRILSMITPPFTIVPGNNPIPASAVRAANIQTANNNVAKYVQMNGYFPQGNYEYNYNVISAISTDEILGEQTFSQDLTPPAPLDLIEPFNEDSICNKKPLLTWQPSIPFIPGALYEVLLVEIKERQKPVEALNYNLPLVNQRGIMNPILLYPPSSKELENGKSYAWQVTAYKNQTVINRSEVWSFTLNCRDSVEVVKDDYGYRDIEDLVKGNYYVAQGFVKFALLNSYNEQDLKYEISCITDPGEKVRSLPKVKLKRGQNKISLDFSHNFSFKDGYSYVMKAYLPNGTSKSLRFVFKDL